MSQLMTEPVAAPATPVTDAARGQVSGGAKRVLTMSTVAFTLMFAVWLMFGILGVPIQQGARAHRPPAGLDQRRRGAQRLAVAPAGRHAHRPGRRPRGHHRDAAAHRDPLLLHHPGHELPATARARLPRRVRRQPVQRRHLVERRLVPQGAPGLRARRLRRRQRRRLGDQAAHRAAPDDHRGHGRRHLPRHLPRRLADLPGHLHRCPGRRRGAHLRHRARGTTAAPAPASRCARCSPRCGTCACGGSASTTPRSSGPTSRSLPGCRSTTSTTSTSRWRRLRCSARPSSSRHPCCARSAAGSPTAGAPAGSCTGPSP